MSKKLVLVALVFIVGGFFGYFLKSFNDSSSTNAENKNSDIENHSTDDVNKDKTYASTYRKRTNNSSKNSNGSTENTYNENVKIKANKNVEEVPQKVIEVLKFIKKNNRAPDNYVGGRKFKNLEQLLPKTDKNNKRINYQEWDVNPKKQGKNRGKERLVTGDDGASYFTKDHYQSFIKIE